jgi:hypothetical protein
MKRVLLILPVILVIACNQQRTQTGTELPKSFNEELRTELMEILKLDQDLRIALDTMENMYDWDSEVVQDTWRKIHYNDSLNLLRIEAIIKEYGWPSKELVGEDQIYGTQLSYDNQTGELTLYAVEDEINLNKRREEMGLGSIESYMEHFGLEYIKPE